MNLQVTVPTLINLSALASLGPAEAVAMKDDVLNALTKHPFFKDIRLDLLIAAGTNLEETVRLTGLGDRSKIPERFTHLSNVIKELTRVAVNVQLQAMDEESQLHTSGLPLVERRTRVPKNRGAVETLMRFSATNIDEPGAALLTAESQEAAFGYQFQFTKLDPAVEENWADEAPGPHRTCKKIIVRGLDSLSRYSFRGRGIGDDGPGPWSKVVTISIT